MRILLKPRTVKTIRRSLATLGFLVALVGVFIPITILTVTDLEPRDFSYPNLPFIAGAITIVLYIVANLFEEKIFESMAMHSPSRRDEEN